MVKKQNAVGLSTLLLGFSVGTLGEQTVNDTENLVKYSPVVKEDLKAETDKVEGTSIDFKSTDMDSSLWDNGGGFLNFDKKEDKDEKVVYVSSTDPEETNESSRFPTNIMIGCIIPDKNCDFHAES